jgi:hypothetical protein
MTRNDRIALDTWVPRGLDERAGAFARALVAQVDPPSWARARSLLWSASRLCAFAFACGHEPEPAVVLSSALIERFVVVGTPRWSLAARRTVRSNLYFLARRVAVRAPAPVPLARGRAQAPYAEAELAAYLALADAQRSEARRQRASGLIALGAGAGLLGADLRLVCGTDVVARSGGVVVAVAGRGARVVPVRAELAARAGGCGLGRLGVRRGRGRAHAAQRDEPPHCLARQRARPTPALLGPTALDLAVALRGRHRARHLHGRGGRGVLPAPRRRGGPSRSGRRGRRGGPPRRRAMNADALARLEAVVDASGVAPRLEALLPVGVRPRQLSVRTLFVGLMVTLADKRAAHLSRVHAALLALGEDDRRRLGVVVEWKGGPHQLTYRQTERTFGLLVGVLAKESSDGEPSDVLQGLVDDLVEASVPTEYKDATRSLAIDWTDIESFARPPLGEGAPSADPEASWGHRRGDGPGQRDELFYGFYLGLATMVREEFGAEVPELVRRMRLTSCHVDPVPTFVPVLEHMVASGVPLGDVLNDSGYSHRVPEHWALPLRARGANLVMDLHPHDRGTVGTYHGALCWNGSLYCPSTPGGLFALEPLARRASAEETAAHDARSAELDRYRFSVLNADDADGHHRVMCPAAAGKLRCPMREGSMSLAHSRPEILAPPEHLPVCCVQVSITVPPSVNAKTRQKHPYPSRAHRLSYGRRSGAERANSTIKDPASNDVAPGWCRVMGLVPMTLMLSCLMVVRNQRVLASFAARQADNKRRLVQGLPPRTRRRRRTTITDLAGAVANAPPDRT